MLLGKSGAHDIGDERCKRPPGVPSALTPLHEAATSDAGRCAKLLSVKAQEAAQKAGEAHAADGRVEG